MGWDDSQSFLKGTVLAILCGETLRKLATQLCTQDTKFRSWDFCGHPHEARHFGLFGLKSWHAEVGEMMPKLLNTEKSTSEKNVK